jgi:hypothetical protein
VNYFASCAGLPVVSGELLIPLMGPWTADLKLSGAQPISGDVTVVIGNLTLVGFVYRSSAYGGSVSARLVGGYGGWRTAIAHQGYGSNSGVKLSTILNDAANACGEKIAIATDTTIGPGYAIADAPASDVLWQMFSQGFILAWYVAPSGVTQTTAWPTKVVSTPFVATDHKTDDGVVTIATEDQASWLPGCTFSAPNLDGTLMNGGVTYTFKDDGQMRLDVMTGTTDRLVAAINAIIDRKVSPTRFYGRYSYTISNPSMTTVDASPNDRAIGLPEVTNVPIAADSISEYVPPDGGECHIQFLDGIPNKPICVWTVGDASTANVLGGTTPAAKLGDTVQSMISGDVLVLLGQLIVTGVAPGTLTVTGGTMTLQGLTPISGTVTTGSGKVNLPV